jgi:hypothetical protein
LSLAYSCQRYVSNFILERNETPHFRAERKKSTNIAVIRYADLNDKGVQKAVLEILDGKENVNAIFHAAEPTPHAGPFPSSVELISA